MPSNVIHGMLYSPERRCLDIVFRNGYGIFRYFAVAPEEWREFKRARSKGTFLNSIFLQRHPQFERVRSQPFELLASLAASVLGASADRPEENVWGFYDGEDTA